MDSTFWLDSTLKLNYVRTAEYVVWLWLGVRRMSVSVTEYAATHYAVTRFARSGEAITGSVRIRYRAALYPVVASYTV